VIDGALPRSDTPMAMTVPSTTIRSMPPAPRRTTLIVLGALGLLATVVTVTLGITNPTVVQPGLRITLACWVTVPYIVAGLIAWHIRPESRLGRLMVIAGFATSVDFLIWSSNDVLYTVGSLADFFPPVLFLHVFLSFPSGRLTGTLEKNVVGIGYGAASLTLVRMLYGEGGPQNLLALTDAPDTVDAVAAVQHLTLSLAMLAGIAVLITRRARSGKPLRLSLDLLVDSFALGLLMLALLPFAAIWWTAAFEPIRLVTFFVMGLAPMVFLAGLLHARLGRASVAALVLELGVNPGPAELETAVARALRDPSATVAYWLPEFDSYADVDGHQLLLDERSGRSATPIIRGSEPVALLLHDPALDDEPRLLEAVTAAAGLAIHNAQLQVELKAQLEELRGSRVRILEAEQRERRRLERDLHDGAQQRLVALSLELGRLEERLGSDEAMRGRLETARAEVAASLAELRDLAHGIHPAAVSDHGLAVALESVATRAAVPVQLVGAPTERLPEQVELAVFFLVCEALANVAKHASASYAVVELSKEAADVVVVEVRDDGVGGASTETGSGLRGLADRVEALGGRLQIWSAPGEGTRLRAVIPCE
jgi:signal transduction histidine kinase